MINDKLMWNLNLLIIYYKCYKDWRNKFINNELIQAI